jgi:hypothetical protein
MSLFSPKLKCPHLGIFPLLKKGVNNILLPLPGVDCWQVRKQFKSLSLPKPACELVDNEPGGLFANCSYVQKKRQIDSNKRIVLFEHMNNL